VSGATQAHRLQNPQTVFLLATLCCLLWGSAYPAVKTGYALFAIARGDVASQLLFAGLRFVGAGALLLLFAGLTRPHALRLPRARWPVLLVLGLWQTGVQYFFFYVGLAHTSGVKASILNAAGTFFSVALAHYAYHDDRLSLRKLLGCIAGLAGVVVVNLGAAEHNATVLTMDFALQGEGFILLAALALSSASMYGRKVSQGMDPVVMTGYQLAVGGVALCLGGGAGGGALHAWSWASAALLLYMAALSAVAFALWGALLKYNRVSTVSAYYFLIPLFGVLLSTLLLGEHAWGWNYLAALVLVSLGIRWVTQEN
jgi:drug/metabolite transporter (DMT)-like permease